jgi:hypothetical protein
VSSTQLSSQLFFPFNAFVLQSSTVDRLLLSSTVKHTACSSVSPRCPPLPTRCGVSTPS